MGSREFRQIEWDEELAEDVRRLVRLAVGEDLGGLRDWTTAALVGAEARGGANVVARAAGVAAGLPAARVALEELGADVQWRDRARDGQRVAPGDLLAEIRGSARDLLTAERLILNLLGRLSGVATLTRRYVDAAAGAGARIYDTRKTTPGWRRLEKYAVRCGGGWNHRTGLFDAILIKDNHLAAAQLDPSAPQAVAAQAVRQARRFLEKTAETDPRLRSMIIEVEVDTLGQLAEVLPAQPDLVLLDNMSLDQLRAAVAARNQARSSTLLEASGGVTLDTVGAIAETGVDRISIGALTHSAVSLDVALDWRESSA